MLPPNILLQIAVIKALLSSKSHKELSLFQTEFLSFVQSFQTQSHTFSQFTLMDNFLKRVIHSLLFITSSINNLLVALDSDTFTICLQSLKHTMKDLSVKSTLEFSTQNHNLNQSSISLSRTILGSGGFGVVYKGETTEKVPTPIAIKVFSKSKPYFNDFRREMQFLQSIIHPHIVTCYGGYVEEIAEPSSDVDSDTDENDEDNTQFCIVFQNLEKIDWSSFIGNEIKCKCLALQVLSALSFLHSLGVGHFDLKLDNILQDENQNIKLIDFGTLKYQSLKSEIHQKSGISKMEFSAGWASPEQCLSDLPNQLSSDIWSFGTLLYSIYSGKRPFGDLSSSDIINLLKKQQGLPGALNSKWPSWIIKTCSDCWKFDTQSRPLAKELLTRLNE